MPKRKRDDWRGDNEAQDPATLAAAATERARRFFPFAEKQLARSLKVAKGFEQQRLGRRIKNCKATGDATVQRLESELSSLKSVNLHAVADSILKKTVSKARSISSHPSFPKDVLEGGAKIPADIPTTNVVARLQATKPVKDCIANVLSGIEHKLGIFQLINSEDEQDSSPEVDEDEPKLQPEEASTEDEEAPDLVEVAPLQTELSSLPDPGQSPESDPGSPVSSDEGESDSALPPRAQQPKPSLGSTFLPTLLGGYISGSDSDEDMLGGNGPKGKKAVDRVLEHALKPRKNRPGQQARRAIWEKKYGENALHLKNDRNRGWDPKRGAVPVGSDKSWASRKSDFSKSRPPPEPKDNDSKPLHPSWIAAKKAKEAKTKAEFQGKKVVFD